MYVLAFDTTARSCSIALLNDSKVISKFVEEMDFGQSETLIPAIQKILNSNHIGIKDLTLMVVCVGPGSFTGVRSSIASTRAFGLAQKKLAIMGISAFEAYAFDIKEEDRAEVNAVIIETKRDDFYYQFFDKNLKKISEPLAGVKEEILLALRNKEVTFTGDGVERFLFQPAGLNIKSVNTPHYLSVEALALCGIKKYNNKIIDYPKPLYLRVPDVCIKKF